MTLRCLLFGHLRSRSRATLDEKRGRWISECRRCRIPMERETDGTWHVAPPAPSGKLVPVGVDDGGSAAPSGSAGETPLPASAATDPTDSSRSRTAKHPEKTVELSTP